MWLFDDLSKSISQAVSDFKRDFQATGTEAVNIANFTAFAEFDYFFAEQTWTASDNNDVPTQKQQVLGSSEDVRVDLRPGSQIRDFSLLVEMQARKLEQRILEPLPSTDIDFSNSKLDSERVLSGRIRDCLRILLQALYAQLICSNHFASLRLTGFVDQCEEKIPVVFDVYLSSRHDWVPYRWLKTKCIIDKKSLTREKPGCHIIQNSEDTNEELCLYLEEAESGAIQLGQCRRISSIAAPTVPLRDLFEQGYFSSSYRDHEDNSFLPADKVELCYKLGLSLLQLCCREWRRISWTVDNIFFLKDPGSRKLLDKTSPYLSWHVQDHASPAVEDDDRLPCDPNLLTFARLLMEIHGGERIVISSSETPLKLRSRISALIKNRRSFSCSQSNFVNAIEACIGVAGKVAAGDDSTPEELQSFLFRNVILNLETYHRQFTSPYDSAAIPTSELESENNHIVEARQESLYDATRCRTPEDESAAFQAERFLKRMEEFRHKHITNLEVKYKQRKSRSLPPHLKSKIKIAIIDSGLEKNHPGIRGARKSGQIKGCRNFTTTDPDDWNDNFGHGTLVSLLLMKIAPEVEIFVAKVSNARFIQKDKLHCIARAVNWAVQVWKVDIINLSLILPTKDDDIEKELKQAINPSYQHATRKIVFAAAGNSGGNAPRGWPASRPGVIAIHATDGQGAAANFNTNADRGGANFATLGRDIKICHKPSGKTEQEKYVYVSGTSYATPIAAGIAANILEFARYELDLSEHQKKLLYSGGCMKSIFKEMMGARGGYEYIQPWGLWDNGNTSRQRICDVLYDIIEQY